MSVIIEEELLDEEMLAAGIGCQMLVSGVACGRPSVARTRQHCMSCRGSVTAFVCARCLGVLRRGIAGCYGCKSVFSVVLDAVL